jgi:hypothetical protein
MTIPDLDYDDTITEAWVDAVADALNTNLPELVQHGRTSLALDGSGRGTITFPTAFSATPTIVATVVLSTATTMTVHITASSSTSFTVQVDSDSTAAASVTRVVNWIAMGVA